MTEFSVGDHVRWNSEAGRVSGTIIKIVRANLRWKGYLHHASASEPQYIIKSDKTEHLAIHKKAALRLVRRQRGRKTLRRRAAR